MPASEHDGSDVFAERLLQVIDEGQRTATYKLALLLALIDACADGAAEDGTAPSVVHTRTIAGHVVRRYLPQVRSFLAGDGTELHLSQINGGRSAVLGSVLRLHLAAERTRSRGWHRIVATLPSETEHCLDEVERTFARYPLRLLQVVGREHRPFLYDIAWDKNVSLRSLHAPGGGEVSFRPGAADHLLRLAPLVRPLIELHWTRMVGRLNRVTLEDERLRDHLFGAERTAFPLSLRDGLAELQQSRCFYCARPLPVRTQVDHFLPWSRWPNDAIENLVLADACSGHKSDYLPASAHVERWASRLDHDHAHLSSLATTVRWPSECARSLALARSCFAHLPSGTPLWELEDRFTEADPEALTTLLSNVRTG